MAEFHVAAIPIGRIDVEEIEAAISRAVKVFRRPMELRDAVPVPREAEDSERGQYRAATVMKRLSTEVLKLKPGKLVGSSEEDARTPYQPDALILCHEPTRLHMRGLPTYALPDIGECIEANLRTAHLTNSEAKFVGISINTSKLSEAEADKYLKEIESQFNLVTVDPVRQGVGRIVEILS